MIVNEVYKEPLLVMSVSLHSKIKSSIYASIYFMQAHFYSSGKALNTLWAVFTPIQLF